MGEGLALHHAERHLQKNAIVCLLTREIPTGVFNVRAGIIYSLEASVWECQWFLLVPASRS